MPSLHAIEYEVLRKFGLATNRKPETLPVSNVASYVQTLLTLLLSSGKSRLKELWAERGGMPSNEALLYFTGLLTPRKEVPRIYPSLSLYVSLQSPSRSLLMNADSGNFRYWQALLAGWRRPYGKASSAIISATAEFTSVHSVWTVLLFVATNNHANRMASGEGGDRWDFFPWPKCTAFKDFTATKL